MGIWDRKRKEVSWICGVREMRNVDKLGSSCEKKIISWKARLFSIANKSRVNNFKSTRMGERYYYKKSVSNLGCVAKWR